MFLVYGMIRCMKKEGRIVTKASDLYSVGPLVATRCDGSNSLDKLVGEAPSLRAGRENFSCCSTSSFLWSGASLTEPVERADWSLRFFGIQKSAQQARAPNVSDTDLMLAV